MELRLGNIEKIFPTIFNQQESNINLANLSWIEPIGLASISIYKKLTGKKILSPNEFSVRKYIELMGIDTEYNKPRYKDTYIPLVKLTRADAEYTAQKVVSKILQYTPIDDPIDKKDFNDYTRYMVLEIINNIIDHSHTQAHAICSLQGYKDSRCQVAIADGGIGFLQAMQVKYPNLKNEAEALELAIQYEVTGSGITMYGSTTKNIGVGLYFVTEIIKRTGNTLKIISNDAILTIQNGQTSISNNSSNWKGSLVCFELSNRTINFDFNVMKKLLISTAEEPDDEADIF